MTTVYVIADSYGDHSGMQSFPYIMAAKLGWTVTVDAIGGTCYNINGGNFGSRVPAAIAAHPDVAMIVGSVNDRWVTTPTDMLTAISALVAGVPRVYICMFNGSAGIGDSGVPWGAVALKPTNDMLRTAAASAGATFIDAQGWITGTGVVGATTGDGNADVYVEAGGVHPNAAGAAFLGTRLACAIRPPSTGLMDF